MSGATRLGVDLGTTWTAAALAQDGRVAPLPLGTDVPAMPSVVAVDREDGGRIVAGDRAERLALAEPAAGAREAKRRLGDTAPVVMAGRPYGPEALMGHLLRHVVEAATAALGGERPDEVVVTHPATWGGYKLDLVREAGRLAGLADGELELVPEPVAAARHYAALGRLAAGDVVAVYDFGGGTFDAAVVRCTVDGAEVLGRPEGLERIGGVDLDQIVLVHVDQVLGGRLAELESGPAAAEARRALARLRAECTAAKEALSHDTEVTIPVALPGLHTEVRMTRDELEAAARARIADTVAALERAVAAAGVAPSALAGVLLAGGSSRMPLVAEEVRRRIGRPTLLDADPKLVVALGAAGGEVAPGAAEEGDPDMPTPRNPQPTGADRTPSPAPPPPPPPPPGAADRAEARAAALRAAAAGGNTAPDRKKRGAAIAGAAAAAGVAAGGGYLAYEHFVDDEDGGGDEPTEAELAEELISGLTESLDAFDDLAAGAGGNGGGGGGAVRFRGDGDSDGGGAAPARGRAPSRPAATPADDAEKLADITDARAELLERFRAWQPPAGADPAEVAAFRAEVEALIDDFQPRPGQSANDALAELRREFDDEVEDFVQDLKIDAVVDRDGDGDADPEPADGPRWEWDAKEGRWEWQSDVHPTREGFEWIPPHIGEDGRPQSGHWDRPRAGGGHEDRPGLDWVEPHVDSSGRTIPGHWQPVHVPATPPPPPPAADDREWVEGHYDEHGEYVKGHWKGGDDDTPPPIIENPYVPPPPPPLSEPTSPTDPYEPPVVRDHRDDDLSDRDPVYRPRGRRDDDDYYDRLRESGVEVRDHRGQGRDRDRDDDDLLGPNGIPKQILDVFDQARPYVGSAPGVTAAGAQALRQRADEADDEPVDGAGAAATRPAAPPEPEPGTEAPEAPEAPEPPADDALGVEAFADASAAEPGLELAISLDPPVEPPAAPAAPATDPAATPGGTPASAPAPAPVPAPEPPPVPIVDPAPTDPGDPAAARDFEEPTTGAPEDEVPSDLDNDPHTPL